MTHEVVLALDLGTDTGYALLRADGRIESGTVKFRLKEGEGAGARYVRFRRWLIDMKQLYPELALLVYEQVMGHGAFQVISAHVYGGFLATLQAFGEHQRIAYRGIGVGTIKKQFAGHGAAQKVDMVRQCEALGFRPQTHNEADAIALLHVVTGRCPLLTMSGATSKKRRRSSAPEVPAGQNPF